MQSCSRSPLRGLRAGKVHVVGLAGSGVRGIVPLLCDLGMNVTGSDKDDSPVLEEFRRRGIKCWVGHSQGNVTPGTDLVLISAAIADDNPEVRAAESRSIRVLKYAQCLGYLMREKQGIAVAGTHGKTTTSAMVCSVLMSAGLDPSFLIGGEHPDLGGGSHAGKGRHFVAEACEFDRSFLNLAPQAAVVTNVEEDHLDYFESLADIRLAFREFVELLPDDGLLVYNRDDRHSRFLPTVSRARARSFSLEASGADWWVEDLCFEREGSRFVLRGPGGDSVPVRLAVPGLHNVKNSLACAAICSWAGVPVSEIALGLSGYRNVRRRFDVLRREPCTIVDDYAHHPTEVRMVVRTARQVFPGRRIVCIFQPHQYSRLRVMLDGFAESLREADEVVVTRVYRARDSEDDVRSVHGSWLAAAIQARGGRGRYVEKFSEATALLDDLRAPDTVFVFLGAGDITTLAHRYAQSVGAPSLRVPGRAVAV
ncbi:MAG: UDP-N-acetylmuramate--L-alanine ligase [Planctomycetota bacterium]|nr:UDP-N-acetylmuramate--L-alanine ligase [Planctomycetota bacterium]